MIACACCHALERVSQKNSQRWWWVWLTIMTNHKQTHKSPSLGRRGAGREAEAVRSEGTTGVSSWPCRFLDTESMATTPRGGSDPNEFSLMGPGKELDTCASVHILCPEVQPAFPTWTRCCFKHQLGLWKMSITSWFQAPLFRTLNVEPGSDQTWLRSPQIRSSYLITPTGRPPLCSLLVFVSPMTPSVFNLSLTAS